MLFGLAVGFVQFLFAAVKMADRATPSLDSVAVRPAMLVSNVNASTTATISSRRMDSPPARLEESAQVLTRRFLFFFRLLAIFCCLELKLVT